MSALRDDPISAKIGRIPQIHGKFHPLEIYAYMYIGMTYTIGKLSI